VDDAPGENLCYLLGCCQCSHLVLIIFPPQTGSHTVLEKTMKLSDIKLTRDGLFELQKGHGDQMPGGNDIVQILFGGIQTALTAKEFAEKDDV
jgi:hypothetical protein